jgi:hypothetical protein
VFVKVVPALETPLKYAPDGPTNTGLNMLNANGFVDDIPLWYTKRNDE